MVARRQVSEYAAKQHLRVVGCYFAHERVDRKEVTQHVYKLADKIAEQFRPLSG